MDATTVPETSSLLSKLQARFPHLAFQEGEDFHWSPSERCVYYVANDPLLDERLLHEVSHAELKHTTYTRDIELIAMERDAWGHARITLGPSFDVTIDSSVIEDDLDTYRFWLHARSSCPECSATGIQTDAKEYTCVACRATWRVNTATGCALRRYTNKKHA
jgi:hypothetical protein